MHKELESLSAPDVSSFRFKIEEADDLVAISCLKYLHYFDRLERHYKRYPLREYAWYNWEKHVHVEGYILRESAFLRRKAVKLYQVLGSHRHNGDLRLIALCSLPLPISEQVNTGGHQNFVQ